MTEAASRVAPRVRRTFTVAEANALLPTLDALLQELLEANGAAREAADLLQDLEAYWGSDVHDPEHADHGEWRRRREEVAAALERGHELVARIHGYGCELKDPRQALVDFYTVLDGQLVFLCWQRGEAEVAYWHTLAGGFAGRKPLPTRDG